VIVGGGVAAASAAAALRKASADGPVTLISSEELLPYERPELSKEFLQQQDLPAPSLVRQPAWYAERSVEVLLGERVTEVDLAARSLTLRSGGLIGFDRLILATGARARRNEALAGDRVHYIREFADAARLREALRTASHTVILGGGFIGSEIAAVLAAAGKRVTIVERRPVLMERAVGPVVGAVLTDVHRGEGVDVRTGRIITHTSAAAHGVLVRTDKETVEGDLLIVGGGAQPNAELALAAGIAVNDGVLVDSRGRTSVPGVWAAGDATRVFHPHYREHLRAEHRDWAAELGTVAGTDAAGAGATRSAGSSAADARAQGAEGFAVAPWYWSDQYRHTIQQAGFVAPGDRTVVRGSMDDLAFTLFAVRDHRIRGAISMNRPGDILAVRRLLFRDHAVTAEELADESFDLKRLRRAGAVRLRGGPHHASTARRDHRTPRPGPCRGRGGPPGDRDRHRHDRGPRDRPATVRPRPHLRGRRPHHRNRNRARRAGRARARQPRGHRRPGHAGAGHRPRPAQVPRQGRLDLQPNR
jgi:3-phenylpropionate/trans-cinnamate dioxygenase ferredoxin reductase subunit